MLRKDRDRLWTLAMNATRARVLRGLAVHGEASTPELVMKAEARKLRDIMSDKPGREYSSHSQGRRSSMEYASDPVAEDRRDFVRQVIALLESHRRAGDFDRLAIFAEHDVLGDLRQLIPEALRALVIHEVPKNLVQLSVDELPRVILAEIEEGLRQG